MLKLNGGLGTGMGLEKAKSLLPLKGEGAHEPLSPQPHLCPQPAPSPCAGDDTFLDFIAKQAAHTLPPQPQPYHPNPNPTTLSLTRPRTRTPYHPNPKPNQAAHTHPLAPEP